MIIDSGQWASQTLEPTYTKSGCGCKNARFSASEGLIKLEK